MEITSDLRLHAGVRAALEHICERHGLSKEDRHELVASVENECAIGSANCTVTIEELEDRMEVTVVPKIDSSGNKSSDETNSAKHKSASPGKASSGSGRIFVKHFQKNATHS